MIYVCRIEMKRHGDNMGNSHIESLFRQHEAKKIAPSSSPLVVDDEQVEDGGLMLMCLDSAPPVHSDTESEIETDDAC